MITIPRSSAILILLLLYFYCLSPCISLAFSLIYKRPSFGLTGRPLVWPTYHLLMWPCAWDYIPKISALWLALLCSGVAKLALYWTNITEMQRERRQFACTGLKNSILKFQLAVRITFRISDSASSGQTNTRKHVQITHVAPPQSFLVVPANRHEIRKIPAGSFSAIFAELINWIVKNRFASSCVFSCYFSKWLKCLNNFDIQIKIIRPKYTPTTWNISQCWVFCEHSVVHSVESDWLLKGTNGKLGDGEEKFV